MRQLALLATTVLLAANLGCDPAGNPNPNPTPDPADPGDWVFQPVDGMICGGGAETGIGVNVGTDPSKLAIVFEGGGACWDAGSCFILQSAANLEVAWGEAHLSQVAQALDGTELLDRNGDDLLSDATWVYVPYCTGDLHAGDSEQVYNAFEPTRVIHHHGDANVVAMLDVMSEDLPDVEELRVIGISAGGYGAQLQADRLADTWPQANMAVWSDSAPLVTPRDGRYAQWKQAWNLRLPEGCADCQTRFANVLETQSASLPGTQFALTTFADDEILSNYFSYGPGTLAPAQRTLLADTYDDADDLSYFAMPGTAHTTLGQPDSYTADGVVLRDWFSDWVEGVPLEDLGAL